MLIYLLRHGQTEYNAQKRYQGQRDIPLSAAGIAQLRQADFAPEVVYVTPLQRTAQTARVFFPGAKLIPVDGLKEMNFGRFEGQTFVQVEQDPEYLAWVQENEHAAHRTGSAGAISATGCAKRWPTSLTKPLPKGRSGWSSWPMAAPRWPHWSGLACPAAAFPTGAAPRGRLCAGYPGLAGAAHPAPGGDRAVHKGERMMEQGLLHLYWGDGKGKTTAHGPCPPRTGQRQTGCHRAVPQGRAERRDPSAGPAGGKNLPGQGRQKFVFQMNEAEKAAARAVQNET